MVRLSFLWEVSAKRLVADPREPFRRYLARSVHWTERSILMIIWLNGAFGAGKTQTAYELHRRLERSYVYDPENAGFFIRDNLPPGLGLEDFQDFPMWRSFNLEMLDYIASRYDGTIIVPMTLTSRAYYDELVGTLSKRHEVDHFILWASRETLLKRLASRGEGPGSWGALQIGRCLDAFETDITQRKIYTDDRDLYEVVDEVGRLCGLTLSEDRRGRLRKLADRLVTQIRHIR